MPHRLPPSAQEVSFRAKSAAGGHSRGTPLRLQCLSERSRGTPLRLQCLSERSRGTPLGLRCLSERSPPQADTVEEPLFACGVFPSGVHRRRTQSRNPSWLAVSFRAEGRPSRPAVEESLLLIAFSLAQASACALPISAAQAGVG